MNTELKQRLYQQMVTIRYFEETLLELFSHGVISGTTHTCCGQEAVAAASMAHIKDGDAVFSNHRCHGHFIAYGADPQALLAEILGKQEGVCAGRGGSQHLCCGTFFTNGIQGGMLPSAAGYALAAKKQNEQHIAVSFIGDGTFGEGIVYETLNLSSLLNIPILIIAEDNGYAQTTPKSAGLAGSLPDRIKAFQIACHEIQSNDFMELYEVFAAAFRYVRVNQKPFCQIVKTYRLGPHSKGDDFRDPAEIESWRKKDPILLAHSYIDQEAVSRIQTAARDNIALWTEKALDMKPEPPDCLLRGISQLELNGQASLLPPRKASRFVDSLSFALRHILSTHPESVILGEDILDPYGGAFKVTKGLSSDYPQRVISTPISEAAIAGLANGMALNRMRPIVEVMFGDFITLMYDQILNHGAKFKWMYHNQVNTPVLIRTPVGGKRGYGPTHSQSPENIFMGVPNLSVIAPTAYHDPGQLLYNAYQLMETPVIFLENKAFYAEKLMGAPIVQSDGQADAAHPDQRQPGSFYIQKAGSAFPVLRLSPEPGAADASIICYGGGLTTALAASWQYMLEEEANIEVICPSLVYPLPFAALYSMLSQASRCVIVIDEGYSHFGWSSEVALLVTRRDRQQQIQRPVHNIGLKNAFISSARELEAALYPSVSDLIEMLKNTLSHNHCILKHTESYKKRG